MWRLHQKNIRLTLNDIKSEKIFIVIWKKGICFMSTDGLFRRYLSAFRYGEPPHYNPAICLLATKTELLNTDLIFLQENLMNAGILTRRLPIPVSLSIYERRIDILGPSLEDAIAEITMALDMAGQNEKAENLPANTEHVKKSTREA